MPTNSAPGTEPTLFPFPAPPPRMSSVTPDRETDLIPSAWLRLLADPERGALVRTAAGRMRRQFWDRADRAAWSLDCFMLHTILNELQRAGVTGMRFILDHTSWHGVRVRETFPELEANPTAIIIVPGSTEQVRALVGGTALEAEEIIGTIRSQRLRPTDFCHERPITHLRPAWRRQLDKEAS